MEYSKPELTYDEQAAQLLARGLVADLVALLATQLLPNSRKIYNSLVILLYCIDIIAPHHHWRIRLKKLLQKNRKFLPQMGFPRDWKQLPIWKVRELLSDS